MYLNSVESNNVFTGRSPFSNGGIRGPIVSSVNRKSNVKPSSSSGEKQRLQGIYGVVQRGLGERGGNVISVTRFVSRRPHALRSTRSKERAGTDGEFVSGKRNALESTRPQHALRIQTSNESLTSPPLPPAACGTVCCGCGFPEGFHRPCVFPESTDATQQPEIEMRSLPNQHSRENTRRRCNCGVAEMYICIQYVSFGFETGKVAPIGPFTLRI